MFVAFFFYSSSNKSSKKLGSNKLTLKNSTEFTPLVSLNYLFAAMIIAVNILLYRCDMWHVGLIKKKKHNT